ncbi:opsin, ultraviolet-sensitive-like isoform X1 [Argiope bruennichi]|uniref:opsin, ultraviolet-sensitive-like isoform X1 n=2 Tax=Argiope bruennichi TaxID=94029 RepID=UPI0024942EDA|nr:opsin, ultraviolet-sensitive-like isoform X1 [Argiope bruennichi]
MNFQTISWNVFTDALKSTRQFRWLMLNASIHHPVGFLDEGPPNWCYETRYNGWNAPPDVYISPYWKQFRAPAPYLHYLLGILYIGLMSVSLIGNGMVIYIFMVARSLRTPANMFVIALAMADLLMMAKTPVFIYNSFNLGPAFGNLGCIIYGVVGAYSGLGSAFCNAIISYDRYRVIVHPFSKAGMSMTKAIIMIILIYVYISPFALLPAFEIWSRYVPEGFLTSCAADFFMHDFNGRSYIVGTWFFGWLIPICIVLYCYFRIFLAVRNHEMQIKEQARKMNVDSIRSNAAVSGSSAEIRIAKTAFCVILMFLFSWVPYISVAFIAGFSHPNLRRITPVVSMIPAMTLKASACFDPFFYAISHPRYRLELQKRLPWLCIHERPEATSGTDDSVSKTTDHA